VRWESCEDLDVVFKITVLALGFLEEMHVQLPGVLSKSQVDVRSDAEAESKWVDVKGLKTVLEVTLVPDL
jgi:hypothetical protein